MGSKRFLKLALLATIMLLPLTSCTPKVESAYTYIYDETQSEMRWMDVKQIGWDFTATEFLLTVQYQTSIPFSVDHYFWGNFYLDTDQDRTTGDPGGFDYRVYFYYYGGGGSPGCSLRRWDNGWAFVKNLSNPTSPDGQVINLKVPLSDIPPSPTAMYIYDIFYSGGANVRDNIGVTYTYNVGIEEWSVLVDGNPLTGWEIDTQDYFDTPGDSSPSFADATRIYTTDGFGKFYMRLDLSAAPPSLSPEEMSWSYQAMYIYFDTIAGGTSIGGIGADYKLVASIETTYTERFDFSALYRWSGTAWTLVSDAILETALGACLELSLRLTDIGFIGPTMRIYIDYLNTWNDDLVSRGLSEVSTGILSASANTVFFIYADPYRMVSPTAPWAAAFAAYDATAAGFIYGLCANEQWICYDSNPAIVVAKPAGNYGEVLLSSKSVVVMGGPIPNWVVNCYERTGQTPLKYNNDPANPGFATQTGITVASLPSTTDFVHDDLFVVMAFEDIHSNFVLIIYGLGWKGTFAGGTFFKEVISPHLDSYIGNAYVFRWQDGLYGHPFDGVPQVHEIYEVYPVFD